MPGEELTWTFDITGDREDLLRRRSRALVKVTAPHRQRQIRPLLVVIAAGGGLLALAGYPAIAAVALAYVVILYAVNRAGWVNLWRVKRLLARSRFAGESWTLATDAAGVHLVGDGVDQRIAWKRVGSVMEFAGGLAIVLDGNLGVIDIPPAALVGHDREQVKAQLAGWIAAVM